MSMPFFKKSFTSANIISLERDQKQSTIIAYSSGYIKMIFILLTELVAI